MFDSLFPNWSNPAVLTAIVAGRAVLNACFTVVAASAVGTRALLTAVTGGLTLLSAGMTILLLRPGGLGHRASFVELSLQVLLLVVAGYAVYANPSTARTIAYAAAAALTVALLLLMIPIYGEAFVAP